LNLKCCLRMAVLSAVGLAGCADQGDDELHSWMADQRNSMRPKVEAVSEPKAFKPQAYADLGALDPFNIRKLTSAFNNETAQAVTNSALIAPELNRRKEPLENFPLDIMVFVGSLKRADKQAALLKVDNLIYQVNVGAYIGQNYGKITQINETELSVREIVQDAAGEWIERQAVLQLQEGKK
jgi:type IV pilus assembly protein PilP